MGGRVDITSEKHLAGEGIGHRLDRRRGERKCVVTIQKRLQNRQVR